MEPLCAEDVSNINLLGQGTVSMALMLDFSCYIRALGKLHSTDGLLYAVLAVQNEYRKTRKFRVQLIFGKLLDAKLNGHK